MTTQIIWSIIFSCCAIWCIQTGYGLFLETLYRTSEGKKVDKWFKVFYFGWMQVLIIGMVGSAIRIMETILKGL